MKLVETVNANLSEYTIYSVILMYCNLTMKESLRAHCMMFNKESLGIRKIIRPYLGPKLKITYK